MNWTRTAALVVGAGACAAWMAAVPNPTRTPAPVSGRGAAAAVGHEREIRLAAQVDRLRGRLTPVGVPHGAKRNPFAFAPKVAIAPKAAPIVPVARPALVEVAPAVAAAAPPPFRLAGIAEDTRAGVAVRTAILSTPTSVLFVKEGDLVPPRYRVSKISADVLELAESGTDVKLRLALK